MDAPYLSHDAVAQDEHALAPVNAVPLVAVCLAHQELGAHLGSAPARKGKRVARAVLLLTNELSLLPHPTPPHTHPTPFSPPLPFFLSMLNRD
jgi:hypothetical protein